MYRRAPMSRDLADLTARSISDSLNHAESFGAATGGYRPSGVFSRDIEKIAAAPENLREVRRSLHATVIDTVRMFLAHAVDHIRALANDMQRDPVPIWSLLTLCRAVQESTVWMCHLLDSPISTEMRLCRIAALWVDDSQPARVAAATFGAEHAAGEAAYHKFKLAELAEGGFTVEVGADQRPLRVRLGQAVAPLRLNLTDEVTRLVPEGAPSPYRLSSGAAHGRPWMLERSATRTASGELVGEGSTAATAAFTVMYCMKAWVGAWGGYFGLDVTGQLTAMHAVMETFGREGIALG